MIFFSDRPGLNCDTQVDNLQRELLKSLNLNIMLEHEQKNWNLSPKIRFLEILKLLPGKILQIWTNPSKIDPNVSVLYKGDVY